MTEEIIENDELNAENLTDTVAAENQPEETETENQNQDDDATDEDADEFLKKVIEAAERRGYLKARNELARAAMASPRLWENPLRRKQKPEPKQQADDTDFLTHITPNVWD